MKSEIEAVARRLLTLADESFEEGRALLGSQHPRGALNRFYYAAFYAARALLATTERDSASHSGVIALFQVAFVKTRAIDPQIAETLPRAFARRQKADYTDFGEVSRELALQTADQVRAFVDECRRVFERLVIEDEAGAP